MLYNNSATYKSDAKSSHLQDQYAPARLFDKLFALGLLIVTSPLFLIIPLLIKIHSRGRIFYVGTRLGKDKEPFNLIKFRTLPENYQQKNGAQLVSSTINISPFVHLLRDSRLDELPQLWNVLRGNMSFIGPRPERPEVYEEKCRHIRDYDYRFKARPGLIGYSQLFTPHGTPKRMRVLIDNSSISRTGTKQLMQLYIYAQPMLVRNFFLRVKTFAYKLYQIHVLSRRYTGKRIQERIRPRDASVHLLLHGAQGDKKRFLGKLVDINAEYFKFTSPTEMQGQRFCLTAERKVFIRNALKSKRKSARCNGEIFRSRRLDSGEYEIVMKYFPSSPLAEYKFAQYFLNQSIIPRHSSFTALLKHPITVSTRPKLF